MRNSKQLMRDIKRAKASEARAKTPRARFVANDYVLYLEGELKLQLAWEAGPRKHPREASYEG